MKRGVVIGKFVPPHKGHQALIEFGAARCDELHVIVCNNDRYEIPGTLRRGWIQKLHPKAIVHLVSERVANDDSEGWAKHTIEILGFRPDVVFTSEDYGDAYARHLGSEHQIFDRERRKVAIAGSTIMREPGRYPEFMAPMVRAFFVKKVALVGAESCGKTSMAMALADKYKTYWVPEYGRFYWEAKKLAADEPIWTTEEFVHIAVLQNQLEDSYAERARGILFCDTNAFMTSIWHRRYLERYDPAVDACMMGRRYDAVLFCDADIPFVQDGTRDGELIRPAMSGWIRERLEALGQDFLVVTGDEKQRWLQVSAFMQAQFPLLACDASN